MVNLIAEFRDEAHRARWIVISDVVANGFQIPLGERRNRYAHYAARLPASLRYLASNWLKMTSADFPGPLARPPRDGGAQFLLLQLRPGVLVLQQTQARAHHFTRVVVAPGFDLPLD